MNSHRSKRRNLDQEGRSFLCAQVGRGFGLANKAIRATRKPSRPASAIPSLSSLPSSVQLFRHSSVSHTHAVEQRGQGCGVGVGFGVGVSRRAGLAGNAGGQ